MKTSLPQCLALIGGLASTVSVAGETRYVNINNPMPIAPYTNWSTAATVIQDAVDVANAGDEIVVTNGIYQTGGRTVDGFLTNRVAVTKPLTLRSVNGPDTTVIRGYQVPGTTNGDAAVRCVLLTNGATLVGFTLTNGATRRAGNWEQVGGGVWCDYTSVVSNCVIGGNSAFGIGGGAFGGKLFDCTLLVNSAIRGGGAALASLRRCIIAGNSAVEDGGGDFLGTLDNCILTGNFAGLYGGGSRNGSLAHCTIAGNSAGLGTGGVLFWNEEAPENCAPMGSAWDCIVYDNTGPWGTDNWGCDGFLYDCCTTPLPYVGVGNITNAPLFVDAAAGNFHLQSNSPCINAGRNGYAPADPDLDGNPRIVGGTVDIGAYEFQSPQSTLSYAWLQQYGLPTDGSADLADSDGDGHNNWQEWRAWTNPTNAASALRLLSPVIGTNGLVISWQSVSGQTYVLERSPGLRVQTPFAPLAGDIAGQPGFTTHLDTNAVGSGPFFYRVGVKE